MSGEHHDPRPPATGDASLDDLLRTLSGPARPHELAGEADVVAAMHARLVSTDVPPLSKEPTVHASPTRRARIATIAAAAAVIAVGGVAAAAPPDWVPGKSGPSFLDQLPEGAPPEFDAPPVAPADEGSTTTSSSTTSTTSTTAVTSTTLAVAETSTTTAALDGSTTTLADPDPSTAFNESLCADGNHGKTVSSVARSVPPGPGHGEAVSEAAQSSCGKDAEEDEADETVEAEDIEDTEDTEDEGGRPDGAGKPDDAGSNGNGNGNGRGNGNGNGKRGED